MVKLTEMKWKVNRLSENTNPFQLRSWVEERNPTIQITHAQPTKLVTSKRKALVALRWNNAST